MKNKEALIVTLLVVAIVLSSISVVVNVNLMNEIKPYVSSSPSGNVILEILPPTEPVAIDGGIDEIG